jgi:hypothetical protein
MPVDIPTDGTISGHNPFFHDVPAYSSHGVGKNTGVEGTSDQGSGVSGTGGSAGVAGYSTVAAGSGVSGYSQQGSGIVGDSQSATADAIIGTNRGNGTGHGCAGYSNTAPGVYGHSISQAGVLGESDHFDGVYGIAHDVKKAGVTGFNPNGLAGFFDGNVVVTKNITVSGDVQLVNADCAEDFDIGAELSLEPGTVVVLGQEGVLFPSLYAYDKLVAGVISGAGEYRPGIVLDKQQESNTRRQPVALLGKVFCKVDGEYGAIEVGDLLTTSPTPGHAMKAADQTKAFGSVIGKALRSFSDGRGLIPILITLH